MTKKKKKAVKKKKKVVKKGTEPAHKFMVVDMESEDVIIVAKSKSDVADAIAARMTEEEIDEREVADRFAVLEICREYMIEAEPQYEVWLKAKDVITADI